MKCFCVVLVAASILLAAACGGESQREKRFDASFARTARLSAQEARPFSLADATEFDWDRVLLAGSYLTSEQVRATLGIDWNGAYDIPEGAEVLIFADGDHVVADYDLPHPLIRGHPMQDWCVGFSQLLERGNALFVVRTHRNTPVLAQVRASGTLVRLHASACRKALGLSVLRPPEPPH